MVITIRRQQFIIRSQQNMMGVCVCVWFIIGFATKSFGGLWSWKVLAPEAMISDPKQHLTDNLIFFATMVPGFF